jgi:hypothetical protein
MFPHPYTEGLIRNQRNAELLREAEVARLIESALDAGPGASAPSVGMRVRDYARQLMASLVGFSFRSGANKPAGA